MMFPRSISRVPPHRAPWAAACVVAAALALAQGCAPPANPGVPTPADRDAPAAASARAQRARIIPLVDHHQHLVGPASVSQRPAPPPAVALPAALDSLLRERSRLTGSPGAGDLYTEDAQVVDLTEETLPWVRGREAAASVVEALLPDRRYIANSLSVNGDVAHLAGEAVDPSGRARMAFSMGLRKDAGEDGASPTRC